MLYFNKIITVSAAIILTSLMSWATSSDHQQHQPAGINAHLAFKNNTLHMHANIPNEIKTTEDAVIYLQAMDPAVHGPTDIEDQVSVELWMPDMGHGSSPTQVKRATDESGQVIPGAFIVSNVYFIMGGKWEVRVTLTSADGNQETQSFEVMIGGGMDHGGGNHGGHH